MHGRGSQASAPASDAATREGRRRPRVRASWRVPNRVDAAEIGADAAQIGPNQAEIQKKKKKKVQNAPFDLT